MGASSRRKGKGGEYEIASLLKDIFYPDGDGYFVRTPMSGAWGHTVVMTGDVVPIRNENIDPKVNFFWEVKRVEDVPVFDLLSGTLGRRFANWLYKAEKSCENSSIFPIVLWRKNRMPWMALFSAETYHVLREVLGAFPKSYSYLFASFGYVSCGGEEGWVMMPLKDFGAWIKKSGVFSSKRGSK